MRYLTANDSKVKYGKLRENERITEPNTFRQKMLIAELHRQLPGERRHLPLNDWIRHSAVLQFDRYTGRMRNILSV